MTRQLLQQLPNALTIARGILGGFIVYASTSQAWKLCFWLLAAALATDFFDGLAAKKLHAKSKAGAILDPIADCLLSACALIGLAGAGKLPLWVIAVTALSAVGIGYIKFLRNDKPQWRHRLQLFSVAYLFTVWGFVSIYYLSLAYGWSWLYPLLSVVLLVGSALLKRHRLRAWYGWLRH